MSIILPQTQKHREAELVQEKAGALIALGEAITYTQHLEEARGAWKEAESLIEKIKDAGWRMERLSQLATALVEARDWERPEAILSIVISRGSTDDHTDAVDKLIKILIQEQGIEITLNVIDRICDKAKPYVEIGPASYEAFSWVDAFLMA